MYSNIIIDVFNLYHRVKGSQVAKDENVITIANKVIDVIENDLYKLQDKSKVMYLLFDPIPKQDFGVSSAFKYSTQRQKVLPDYKINRKFNYCQGDLIAIDWVRKYFSHKGDLIAEVSSSQFEADDFVESLLEQLRAKNSKINIALVTTDNDWARYLSKDVVMLNKEFSLPYTYNDFLSQYGFLPTINSVTFFKALYGDISDNIQGALMQKRLKKLNFLKKEGFEFVKEIATSTDTIDDILQRVSSYNLGMIKEDTNTNPAEKKFYFSIIASDFKNDLDEVLFNNIEVIRSQCKDVSKYIKTKDIDEKFNNFIEEVLKRKKPEKQKFKFGKVKV